MLFSFGMRTPYSRWSDAVLGFLRDVSEPYLRLFRKFIPPLGAFDLSPMIAIIVLYVVRSLAGHTASRAERSGRRDRRHRVAGAADATDRGVRPCAGDRRPSS